MRLISSKLKLYDSNVKHVVMKLAILNQNYCPLMSYCSETKISKRLLLCNLLKNKIVNAYLNQFFSIDSPLTFDFNQKIYNPCVDDFRSIISIFDFSSCCSW